MWPDQVSNPGPLTYETGALPTALSGPALLIVIIIKGCFSAQDQCLSEFRKKTLNLVISFDVQYSFHSWSNIIN